MKKTLLFLSMTLICFLSIAQSNYKPPKGYVPDEETAKKIAEAIWAPIYGREHIASEKPFEAKLVGDTVWLVEGSLHKENHGLKNGTLTITSGGVAYIEIRKKDCKVLKVIHGK